jgi:O-antigen/teichoic acid export membrane protein
MSQKPSLANATVIGTFWVYLSSYSGKFLFFISTIILARLLSKDDFGVAGYALLLISFIQFPDLGLATALIYFKKDSKLTNTAFWLSLLTGFSLGLFTFLIAPLAGMFFSDDRAVGVTRVLALYFPLASLGSIQEALFIKDLAFKNKILPQVAEASSRGISAIVLAWFGFGAWSIVISQIIGTAIQTSIWWLMSSWRPTLEFSTTLAKPLLSYGLRIIGGNILATTLLNTDYLCIGYFLNAAALGVYTLAFRIPELVIMQFCTILGNVLFPIYAKIQDDPEAMNKALLITVRYVTVITFPIGVGLMLVAEPLVLTTFGQKWVEAIPVMQIIPFYATLRSITYHYGSVYKSQGKPELVIHLNLFLVIFTVPVLWYATSHYGTIVAVAQAQAVLAFLGVIVQSVVVSNLLNIQYYRIAESLRPGIIGSIVMIFPVLASLQFLQGFMPIIQLTVSVLVGAVVYALALWWLQREIVNHGIKTFQNVRAKR